MISNILSSGLASLLLPAAVVLISGLVAGIRPPWRGLLTFIQHFAAGMVLAAIGSGLLPNILRWSSPFVALGAFALGIVTTITLKWTALKHQREDSVTAKVLICGILIGLGIVAVTGLAGVLTIAVTVEVLFLVLWKTADLKASTGRLTAILAVSSLTLLFLVGASAGSVISSFQVGVFRFALAFAAGAVLCFVTQELLIAARERQRASAMAAIFCLGFSFVINVID